MSVDLNPIGMNLFQEIKKCSLLPDSKAESKCAIPVFSSIFKLFSRPPCYFKIVSSSCKQSTVRIKPFFSKYSRTA